MEKFASISGQFKKPPMVTLTYRAGHASGVANSKNPDPRTTRTAPPSVLKAGRGRGDDEPSAFDIESTARRNE
jgi:hypothetical protein